MPKKCAHNVFDEPVLATVETDDAQVYIGVIVPIDNYQFKVQTGLRGRPVILHMRHVVEVLPVNNSNPHIERKRSVKVGPRKQHMLDL